MSDFRIASIELDERTVVRRSREIEQERHLAAQKVEADRRTAQELEIAKQVQARLFPHTQCAGSTWRRTLRD